jgi:hypothetical protein
MKIRPRRSGAFRRDEKMGVYLEAYQFTPDSGTGKPGGSIEWEVVRNGSSSEELSVLPGASASRVTLEKLLALTNLAPGEYTLKLKIIDRIGNQTLAPGAVFTVI